MKYGDYSPAASPSPNQQQDALRKGLGRALQWALSGRLNDEPLLAACLRDQRYDMQIDDSRGDWLWRIIRAIGATERFRVPILHALYDLSDDRSANQLCELARFYAETGDETFRTRLYEIVDQKPLDLDPWLGEEEIIGLDGERGFLFAAGVRGRQLAKREWECDDENPIYLATRRFGEQNVSTLLEASSDGAVKRFQEGWRRERQRKAEASPLPSHRERMAAIPVEEVFRASNGEGRCFWLRGWGKYAKAADLQAVLQYLWTAREPRVIANLLKVFSGRALPEFDARLIELCRHGDKEVREWSFRALEQNAHPLVREFALKELPKGVHDRSVTALFINNYRHGDENRILEAMELPADPCELHWLLMNSKEILEKHPEADCSRLGVITYVLTPCARCRFHAAQLLLNRQVAPEWLAEECRYDSEKDCQQLVEKAASSTEAS
jgi:hypothetical protein